MSGNFPLPSTSGPRHILVWVLAVGYGAVLAVVAFWPTPIDQPVAGLLDRVIGALHERGMPAFIDYDFVEFVANVALFVPIGIAFGLALPTRWWLAMLLSGPVLSAAIEVAQRELLSERYASVADVVANTVGATLGVGVALAVRASVAYRDRRLIARYEAQKHLLGSVP